MFVIVKVEPKSDVDYAKENGRTVPQWDEPGYAVTPGTRTARWVSEQEFLHLFGPLQLDDLSFAQAWANCGAQEIQRAGWNGAGLWVRRHVPADGVEPHAVIVYPNGRTCSWVPSNADMFASDWRIKRK